MKTERLAYYKSLARRGNKSAQRVCDAFDPDQPREPDGKWGAGSSERYEASKAEAARNPAYAKAHGRAIKNEAERNYKAAENNHKEAAASTQHPGLQEYHTQKASQMKIALRHKYDLPSAERIRESNERHAAAMSPVGRYGM